MKTRTTTDGRVITQEAYEHIATLQRRGSKVFWAIRADDSGCPNCHQGHIIIQFPSGGPFETPHTKTERDRNGNITKVHSAAHVASCGMENEDNPWLQMNTQSFQCPVCAGSGNAPLTRRQTAGSVEVKGHIQDLLHGVIS